MGLNFQVTNNRTEVTTLEGRSWRRVATGDEGEGWMFARMGGA